jgi:hypothetical protein
MYTLRQLVAAGLESSFVRLPNAVRVITLAGAVAAVAFALGPPQVLWQNAGPSIEYPWTARAGGLVGALALAGLGRSLQSARGRVLTLIPAGILVLWSGELFAYRLTATELGVARRDLSGSSSVPWRDVTRVDLESGHVAVHGRNGTVRIPTNRISPEDRARLERTISRHVREATPGAPP